MACLKYVNDKGGRVCHYEASISKRSNAGAIQTPKKTPGKGQLNRKMDYEARKWRYARGINEHDGLHRKTSVVSFPDLACNGGDSWR